jgi:hypothetical protein
MAHYAQLDETNTVTNVIVVNNETIYNLPYPESEPVGQAFIASLGFEGVWLETSYNSNYRGRFAGIGFSYLHDADVFVVPQPFPSWSLDANYDWQAPIERPADGKQYLWDEANQVWVESPAI